MFNAVGNFNSSWKKKIKSQLIPAIFFKKIKQEIVKEEVKVDETIQSNEIPTESKIEESNQVEQTKVPQESSSGVSALSLKSIRKKRELESTISHKQINPEDLPKDEYTFEELKEHWDFCAQQFYKTGRMLMSSTMNMAQLTLNEDELIVEFPNTGSKLSFEENLYDLVSFIHRKLNNYHLKIEVKVNETVEVKKAYTIDDKLNYLKELNPVLDNLIKTFDLDIKP